ncbi:hypothetical protein QZH41_004532 [Actinostola sp. cb2023]|nr:hypothetical protein QZH41_004532 [Actinostola sp. cb2023]
MGGGEWFYTQSRHERWEVDEFSKLGIEVKDSLNFISRALRYMPDMFDLEETKGYFPHRFNTDATINYGGPYPDAEYYGADFMVEKDRSTFLEWHTAKRAAFDPMNLENCFDLEKEKDVYCEMDVVVLAQAMMKYRQICLEEDRIDPLKEVLTLQAFCLKSYRINHMPPDSIGVLPAERYRPFQNQSTVACQWLWVVDAERDWGYLFGTGRILPHVPPHGRGDSSGQVSRRWIHIEKASVDEATIKAISELNIGQRDPLLHIARKKRLTASNFGAVLTAKRPTPSLIERLLGERDISKVRAIAWGVNNEAEAVKAFTAATALPVKGTGIWLHENGILGASPDGLIGNNHIVEIKCSYTARDMTIDEALQTKSFYLERGEDNSLMVKKSHVYRHQVQGQLHITKRDYCYFVVWTTNKQQS